MVGINEGIVENYISAFKREMWKVMIVFIIMIVIIPILTVILLTTSFIHALLTIGGEVIFILCLFILRWYTNSNVTRIQKNYNPLNTKYTVYCSNCTSLTFKGDIHILPNTLTTCKLCGQYMTVVLEGDHRLFDDGDEGFSLI